MTDKVMNEQSSELRDLILSVIPTGADNAVTRREIATAIGRPTTILSWYDIKILKSLVDDNIVAENKRKIAVVKAESIYHRITA